MYTLSTIKETKEAINTIILFAPKDRYYWISKLSCCDAVKGYLIVYFNL